MFDCAGGKTITGCCCARSGGGKPAFGNARVMQLVEAGPLTWERSLPVVIGQELIPAFVMEDLINDQAHAL
jgi:hypothetical protein